MAAVLHSALLIFTIILPNITCNIVYSKLPEVTAENNRSHLELPHIQRLCKDRDYVCKTNDTNVCTIRIMNETTEYKTFENSCYLFLSNMCDYPGEGQKEVGALCKIDKLAKKPVKYYSVECRRPFGIEYHIINDIWCDAHALWLEHRRKSAANGTADHAESTADNATNTSTENTTDATVDQENRTESLTDPPLLRQGRTVSRIYDLDSAFDYHACPLTCPDTYSPVCVSANRGAGKYFRFYTFVNHCQGDLYYCKHYEEFAPPPDAEEEDVNSSRLSWSYCGAFRYMQFARFSEVLSSMGHYGWLAGDARYSAIVEPNQRRPGLG